MYIIFLSSIAIDFIFRSAQLRKALYRINHNSDDDVFASNEDSFKSICKRLVKVLPELYLTDDSLALDMFCCKCHSASCDRQCVSESDELLIFDIGSKTTWLKFGDETTGQLSMHPTLNSMPRNFIFPDDNHLSDYCTVCNRSKVMRESLRRERSVSQKCAPPVKSDKTRFATALSKLSLKKWQCLDSDLLDSASACDVYESSLSTALIQAASDVEQGPTIAQDQADMSSEPLDEISDSPLNAIDASCYQSMVFLIRHMLKKNGFLLKNHIPYVICEPHFFNSSIKLELARYAFEELKVPGYVVC